MADASQSEGAKFSVSEVELSTNFLAVEVTALLSTGGLLGPPVLDDTGVVLVDPDPPPNFRVMVGVFPVFAADAAVLCMSLDETLTDFFEVVPDDGDGLPDGVDSGIMQL